MKDGWVDRLGHEIANDQIGISCPEITTVTLYTLPKGRIRTYQFPFGRKLASKDHVPRSKESSLAILNFSLGVIGFLRFGRLTFLVTFRRRRLTER